MTRLDQIRQDEGGTTLVEVIVGTAVGMVVLYALTMVILTTIHGSARVSARVHATQNARIALTNLMEELHSACLAPKITPIQAGSTGTSLDFVHGSPTEGSAPAPKPIRTVVTLNQGTLSKSDYAWASGATPQEWTFSNTPTVRQLASNVGAVPPSSSIFTYYVYEKGNLVPIQQGTTLTTEAAASTVQVRVALAVSPSSTPIDDENAPASIQNSATLRLTPPSFNESAPSPPCQ